MMQKSIPVSEYIKRVKNESIPFSERETYLADIYLGVWETRGSKNLIFNLTDNCFRCMGSGEIENPWRYISNSYTEYQECEKCHGRGQSDEIKATKVEDGYYLISHWKGYDDYECYEIDGFNEFLHFWKSIYYKFTGR